MSTHDGIPQGPIEAIEFARAARHVTKAFRYRGSVAIPLPAAWGIEPGETFEIRQSGNTIHMLRVRETA